MNYEIAKSDFTEFVKKIKGDIEDHHGYVQGDEPIITINYKYRAFERAELLIENHYRSHDKELTKFLKRFNQVKDMIGVDNYSLHCESLADFIENSILVDITTKEKLDAGERIRKESDANLRAAVIKYENESREQRYKVNDLTEEIERLVEKNKGLVIDVQNANQIAVKQHDDWITANEEKEKLKKEVTELNLAIGQLKKSPSNSLNESELSNYELQKLLDEKNQLINDISWQRDEIAKERDKATKETELVRNVLSQSNQRLTIQLSERPTHKQYSSLIQLQYILILSLATFLNFATNQWFSTPIKINLVVEGLILLSLSLFYYRTSITERFKRRLFKRDDKYGRIIEFLYEDKSKYYDMNEIQNHFPEFNQNEIKITVDKLVMEKMIVFENNQTYSILLPGINYIDGHIKNYQTKVNNGLNLLLRFLPFLVTGIATATLLFNSVFKSTTVKSNTKSDSTSTKNVTPFLKDTTKQVR